MLHVELLLTGKGFRELESDGGTSTPDLDYYEVPVRARPTGCDEPAD